MTSINLPPEAVNVKNNALKASMGPQLSWLERSTHNRQVPGSSPGGPTIVFKSSSTEKFRSASPGVVGVTAIRSPWIRPLWDIATETPLSVVPGSNKVVPGSNKNGSFYLLRSLLPCIHHLSNFRDLSWKNSLAQFLPMPHERVRLRKNE